ncbi:double zinc ribbon domain-containing protein [Poseidonocella sedimentorum]|uniref:ComF family protein n=1 Tax=Poseidonocella sedimentorum TaxID=871652 RepID=A0A1I6D4F6_9RHOB|nr:double zinc ribbon domain-containing protein [Poseidonocella sedimentorum]SFR00325.1 comF family protein [Poseidonocella sedimentorum]
MKLENTVFAGVLQTALRVVYPARCLGCGEMVEGEFGLCGSCWRQTPFIEGPLCHLCGAHVPGGAGPMEFAEEIVCEACTETPRPWDAGRAALHYEGRARQLILQLKHSDRDDIARPAARWMARAAREILAPDMLVAPVPLHWSRMMKRRYNQAGLLARGIADVEGLTCVPDLLERHSRTESLKGKDRDARFAELSNRLRVAPRHRARLSGKPVLIVDDVMTSGATFSAATEACLDAGARRVCVVSLARAARDA